MGSNYCRSLVLVKGNKAVDQTVSLSHTHTFSVPNSVFLLRFFFLLRRALVCSNPPSISKCLCNGAQKVIITTQAGEHRQMPKNETKQANAQPKSNSTLPKQTPKSE